ncbi:MAG: PDZ domain-containing protein [Chthonomonas sp.]|nr:PDZ domain-containing protein [Chthonomonas sp.]
MGKDLTNNMKTLRSLAIVASVAVMAAPAFAQSTSTVPVEKGKITPEQKKEVLEQLNNILLNNAFIPGVDFKKWPEYLETQQAALDKAETATAFSLAVNSAINRFGASHIVFNTPEAADFQRTGKMVGLGIQPEVVEEGMKIMFVFEGSAASEAGLEVGDIIMEADGKKPTGPGSLRGDEGTKVQLKVKRGKNGKVDMITVTRRAFSTLQKEELKWLNADVAVLKIPSFMTYDFKLVETLMKEVADKGAKTLAVDLRGNGGGLVVAMQHLMAQTMPSTAKTGVFISRSVVDRFVEETKGSATDWVKLAEFSKLRVGPTRGTSAKPFAGQLICMINGGSGSASEIYAAGARDAAGATILGERSAGAVLASMMWPLKHGFQIQFPFQDYVTIKGVRLEGNGVSPDVKVKNQVRLSEPDPAVSVILELSKKSASSK